MARGCVFQPSYTVTLPDGTKETRKSPTFWIQYRDGQGIKRREAIGDDKELAENALDVANTRAIKERAGLPTQNDAALPVAELLKAYLDAQASSVTPGYLSALKHRLETIATKTRAVTVKDLTPERIEAFLAELAETRMKKGKDKTEEGELPSARTINVYFEAIRGVMNWAVHRRKLTHNPLDCIQKRPELEKRHARRPLTEAELARLLAAALEGPRRRAAKSYKTGTIPLERQAELAEQGRRNALIYRLLFTTGLRVNEARLLTWADLDLDAATLTTRPEWTGNKSGRVDKLPLAPGFVELLRDWRARHPADDNKPVITIPLKMLKTFYLDLAAAGIAKRDAAGRVVDLHALRHTHGTRLMASGADIKTVQALMRHATPALTLGIYVHKDKGRMAAAVADLPDVKPAPRPGPESEAAAALKNGTFDAPILEVGAREVQGTGRRNTQGKAVATVSQARSSVYKTLALPLSYTGDTPLNNAAQDCKQVQDKELTPPAPLQSENCEHCTKPHNETLNCNELVQGKCKGIAQPPAPVLPPDLQELAGLWPSLPDAVKAGFIATAKAIGGKA